MTRPGETVADRGDGTVRDAGDAEAAAAISASSDAVDERLKTRTMDEAPMGITIADATRSDMPLIYANAAFERITGYPPSYAVGRNCRFLQGKKTRKKPVRRIRAAIERGEGTTVEIRNYRRSGELFWNEVTIAPLRDETGEITHYVGFQQEITRRKQAEEAATKRAVRIEQERLAQERLLVRLDGVITDVTEAVARASSRAEIQRGVVRRVADTYAGAWLGTYDPATETVTLQIDAGTTEPGVEGLEIDVNDPDERESSTAVAAAFRDRRVHIEPIESDAPTEAVAVAAVPLYFGTATYGVLAVYLPTEGVQTHERDVLTALGRIVAIGINALESRRTLHGDEAVEFRVAIGGHPLVSFAEGLSCRLQSVGAVGDREQQTLLFELRDAPAVDDETVHAAAEQTGVTVHTILAAETHDPVVELSFEAASLRDLLTEYSGELCGWEVDGNVAVATIEVGREELARSLANAAMERFERADLVGYRRRERRHETRREFVAEIESRLTERQRVALIRAYTSGYFEWPHGTSGDEIAASMGISRSTFHQHLRAAQRKVAAAMFDR